MTIRLMRRLGPFIDSREGVAAVEFALILPFLLLLYLGSIELGTLITVDRRVTTIAGSIGDLVARVDGELPASDLADYFKASEGIITPYSSTGLTQVVTCVFVDSGGNATVQWSEGYNGGTEHAAGANYALPAEMIAIALDSYVIVAEAAYSHTPLLGLVFTEPFALRSENFYIPRSGALIEIT